MKKHILGLALAIILSIIPITSAFAAEDTVHPDSEVPNVNLSIDELNNDESYHTCSDGYYYWDVASKTKVGSVYDSWRDGPGKITVSKSDTVTNTISGSYTTKGDIATALNVTIGKSKSYSVAYSVDVPSGKSWMVIYRPRFTQYKVVQKRYYKIDGHSSATGETKTCYVNVFSDWSFSHKNAI